MPSATPRDYDLDVFVELMATKGLLMSTSDEERACAIIAQCVLGTIQGQPPLMQDRLIHMLDKKKFSISFEIRKIT